LQITTRRDDEWLRGDHTPTRKSNKRLVGYFGMICWFVCLITYLSGCLLCITSACICIVVVLLWAAVVVFVLFYFVLFFVLFLFLSIFFLYFIFIFVVQETSDLLTAGIFLSARNPTPARTLMHIRKRE